MGSEWINWVYIIFNGEILFDLQAAPWNGLSLYLEYTLCFVARCWPSFGTSTFSPVDFVSPGSVGSVSVMSSSWAVLLVLSWPWLMGT